MEATKIPAWKPSFKFPGCSNSAETTENRLGVGAAIGRSEGRLFPRPLIS